LDNQIDLSQVLRIIKWIALKRDEIALETLTDLTE
jgi:hypothetical protein